MFTHLTIESAAKKLDVPVSDILQLAEQGEIQILRYLESEKVAKRFTRSGDEDSNLRDIHRKDCPPGFYPICPEAVTLASDAGLQSIDSETLCLDAGEGFLLSPDSPATLTNLRIAASDFLRLKRMFLKPRVLQRKTISPKKVQSDSHWTKKRLTLEKAVIHYVLNSGLPEKRLRHHDGSLNIAYVTDMVDRNREHLNLPAADVAGATRGAIERRVRSLKNSVPPLVEGKSSEHKYL